MAEKMFIEALKKAFKEDPTEEKTTFYNKGGWSQSERKREFVAAGKDIAAKRGIPNVRPRRWYTIRTEGPHALPGFYNRYLC